MCVWGVGCSLDPHRYSVEDLRGPHLNGFKKYKYYFIFVVVGLF